MRRWVGFALCWYIIGVQRGLHGPFELQCSGLVFRLSKCLEDRERGVII